MMEFANLNVRQKIVILISWIVNIHQNVLYHVRSIELEMVFVMLLVIMHFVNEIKAIVKIQNFAMNNVKFNELMMENATLNV